MSDPVLPARYSKPWRKPFDEPIREHMSPESIVLDIGSGRHPAVKPADRPTGVTYVGLDISAGELAAAGSGAYSETIAADATEFLPELAGRFDLAISWQVLEHVSDLAQTIENVHRYLRPGGLFVALFSGSWSAFGMINRILPDRIGSRIVDRTMKRTEQNLPVFPAYYDRCSSRSIRPLLSDWATAEIEPLYNGASYFAFSRPLLRGYLAYENFLVRRGIDNLATHYLVRATSA